MAHYYTITSKGNWKNFMAYEDWNFKSEVVKLGGWFYLAKLVVTNDCKVELIPQGNPLKKTEFTLVN